MTQCQVKEFHDVFGELIAQRVRRSVNVIRRSEYFAANEFDEKASTEDICADLWVKVLQSNGPSHENARAWLFLIARNLVADFSRAFERKPTERMDYLSNSDRDLLGNRGFFDDGDDDDASRSFDPRNSAPTPEMLCIQAEDRKYVDSLLAQLPVRYRAVLRYSLDGLTAKEIAERTREPLSTVKAKLYRGQVKLGNLTGTEVRW
ncbi:MAG: RNA polymerase sigma factor [Acidobacteriaceae bacterium]|jgi:RNA polymerase sigma-70 factor (ECF subfamily)